MVAAMLGGNWCDLLPCFNQTMEEYLMDDIIIISFLLAIVGLIFWLGMVWERYLRRVTDPHMISLEAEVARRVSTSKARRAIDKTVREDINREIIWRDIK